MTYPIPQNNNLPVPVLADNAESNHTVRSKTEAASDSIGGEARESTTQTRPTHKEGSRGGQFISPQSSFERFILHHRLFCEHEGCKFRLTPAIRVNSLHSKPMAVCAEHYQDSAPSAQLRDERTKQPTVQMER
jgi:hypothetical protein